MITATSVLPPLGAEEEFHLDQETRRPAPEVDALLALLDGATPELTAFAGGDEYPGLATLDDLRHH